MIERKKPGTAEVEVPVLYSGSQEKGELSLALQAEKAALLKCLCIPCHTSSPQLFQQLGGGRARVWHLSMHLSLQGPFPPFLRSTAAGTHPSPSWHWGTSAPSFLPAPLPGQHSEHHNGILCHGDCVLLLGWGGEGLIIFLVQWEAAIWNKLL